MPAKAMFAVSSCPREKWTVNTPGKDLINTIDEICSEMKSHCFSCEKYEIYYNELMGIKESLLSKSNKLLS